MSESEEQTDLIASPVTARLHQPTAFLSSSPSQQKPPQWKILQTNVIHKINKQETNETFVNNYKLIRKIGEGRFAKVKLCEHIPPNEPANRRQFAIKIYSKRDLSRLKTYTSEETEDGGTRMRVVTAFDRVREEIQVMRVLYHRNVVLLFEVMEAESTDKL